MKNYPNNFQNNANVDGASFRYSFKPSLHDLHIFVFCARAFFFPDSMTKLGDKLQIEKKETRADSLHFPLVKCVDETPILSEL